MKCHPVNPYPESKNTILISNIKCLIIDACKKKLAGKWDILSISSYGFTYKHLTDSLLRTVAFEGHFKLMTSLSEIMKGSWKTAWCNQKKKKKKKKKNGDDVRGTCSLKRFMLHCWQILPFFSAVFAQYCK